MNDRLRLTTGSGAETSALGEQLAGALQVGDVVLLHGDLGAGKTTFTQGIARGMGFAEQVQSPTFTLVAEHGEAGGLRLYHLDLYRLADPDELESFGYEQYLDPGDGVTVIEWPERAGDWLPARYLLVTIEGRGADLREIEIRAMPDWGSFPELPRMLHPKM